MMRLRHPVYDASRVDIAEVKLSTQEALQIALQQWDRNSSRVSCNLINYKGLKIIRL
jgi:hypothetical protein